MTTRFALLVVIVAALAAGLLFRPQTETGASIAGPVAAPAVTAAEPQEAPPADTGLSVPSETAAAFGIRPAENLPGGWTATFDPSTVAGKASPQSAVTVNTASIVVDAPDRSSVIALLNDPGPDTFVSFDEALEAIHNEGGGGVITFSAPFVITHNFTIFVLVPGVTIDGDSNGDTIPDVTLDGPQPGLHSISYFTANNVLKNTVITGVSLDGAGATNNLLINNYMGVTAAGTGTRAENTNGVEIESGANNNTVGGMTAADRNILSGNNLAAGGAGVLLHSGATNNTIIGNYVGLDKDGNPAPNIGGISFQAAVTNNTAGGDRAGTACTGACNVISGNSSVGVNYSDAATTGNVTKGNYIGLNPAGTAAAPNVLGFAIGDGPTMNTIGGDRTGTACTGPCNFIGGNSEFGGIVIGDSNMIKGNFVGTNTSGTASATAIPNTFSGIILGGGAASNTIGGVRSDEATCDGPCNLISGNGQAGIALVDAGTSLNIIKGNHIGANLTDTGAIPNGLSGVHIQGGASQNTIGGDTEEEGNVIAHNLQDGIVVLGDDSIRNTFKRNRIHENTFLGIDLGGNGVSPNDLDDSDTGPNNLQNYPAFTVEEGSITVDGRLKSTPNTNFRLEFFVNEPDASGPGEGQDFIGHLDVATDAMGDVMYNHVFPDSIPAGGNVTATATDSFGNTSEFSCSGDSDPNADTDQDGLKDVDEINTSHTDPCLEDTDGDGLLDPWEVDPSVPNAGFDVNGDTMADVARDAVFRPYMGETPFSISPRFAPAEPYAELNLAPDPLHKDIYLEMDWQDCWAGGCPLEGTIPIIGLNIRLDPVHHAPNIDGLKDAIAVFAGAPVENPDGNDGINLRILIDEQIEHIPNCDQGTSAVRPFLFGNPTQRTNADVMTAKDMAFRYVWSGHSSLRDSAGPCPLPSTWEFAKAGVGAGPLADYDLSPFGDALIPGKDILVTLGPIWVCPLYVIEVGGIRDHETPCFRGVGFPPDYLIPLPPGMFPATVPDSTGTLVSFPVPIHLTLGTSSNNGARQLWGRTLMRLLGNSLGIGNADALNEPQVPGFTMAESYTQNGWDDLQYPPGGNAGSEGGAPEAVSSAHAALPDPTLGDLDLDGDGTPENIDNCPGQSNVGQADLDQDGIGDACDADRDGDGIPNVYDAFPDDTDNDGTPNATDPDIDGDGHPNGTDNCPIRPNADQADTDADTFGNACDNDDDGDGLPDLLEVYAGSDPLNAASTPEFLFNGTSCSDGIDNDLDGFIDAADTGCQDDDNDTAPNSIDNCPGIANTDQQDIDLDGMGILCDTDNDNDGCADVHELGPTAALGGQRDPINPFDFYDITNNTGVVGARDRGITGFDLSLLVSFGGTTLNGPANALGKDYDADSNANTVADGREIDYAGILGPASGPDGAITGFDLSAMVNQGGDICPAPPP